MSSFYGKAIRAIKAIRADRAAKAASVARAAKAASVARAAMDTNVANVADDRRANRLRKFSTSSGKMLWARDNDTQLAATNVASVLLSLITDEFSHGRAANPLKIKNPVKIPKVDDSAVARLIMVHMLFNMNKVSPQLFEKIVIHAGTVSSSRNFGSEFGKIYDQPKKTPAEKRYLELVTLALAHIKKSRTVKK